MPMLSHSLKRRLGCGITKIAATGTFQNMEQEDKEILLKANIVDDSLTALVMSTSHDEEKYIKLVNILDNAILDVINLIIKYEVF